MSRKSNAAREAALKIKCEQEGFELLEVSYYFKNGKKKRKIKKRKVQTSQKLKETDEELMIKSIINTHSNQPNEYTFSYNNPTDRKRSSVQSQSYRKNLNEGEELAQTDSCVNSQFVSNLNKNPL